VDRLAAPRLAGPVFRGNLRDQAENRDLAVAVIPGGFAAVETEIAIVIGRDIPLRDRPWTDVELIARIGSMRLAMEIAGSPLATINQLGPPAVVSDFGNNTAIALGDAITGWQDLAAQRLATAMRVDGVEVGRGSPAAVPGGPLRALQFLVEHLAGRGRWLVRGDVISTGATTGIHLVRPGQTAEARITNCPPLAVRITAATPTAA
jgi:2-keto-4-pentenoate hydratase